MSGAFSPEKIVLVTRKTRLEELVERHNTAAQAKFVIERGGGDFTLFQREHDVYHRGLDRLKKELSVLSRIQTVERTFLPNFIFTDKDIIVTLGIDGLVVNTAKYLSGQPLVAVNPDPETVDGILLPFAVDNAAAGVREVFSGKHKARSVTMGEARLNDGQRLLAFNDFFVGVNSHLSARYRVRYRDGEERHSSCGILVATGAGSTGWLSSLFNMARGMVRGTGGQSGAISPPALAWESQEMFFVVREPFVSKVTGAEIVCGKVTKAEPLTVISEMRDNGVIFSDGIENDFLSFQAGATVTITPASIQTHLVVANK